MVFIYILELQQGKYYVGKTDNPLFRLDDHFNSNGSAWTNLYKPIQVLELIPNCDNYDEDKYTRKYMDKYGVNNVRGGSFVTIKLDESMIDYLTQMSNGTTDKCFICGRKGHFANKCEEYEYDVWCCEYCDKEFTEESKCIFHEKYCKYHGRKLTKKYYDDREDDCCFRCGRKGHYASSCYASTHIKGYYLK